MPHEPIRDTTETERKVVPHKALSVSLATPPKGGGERTNRQCCHLVVINLPFTLCDGTHFKPKEEEKEAEEA